MSSPVDHYPSPTAGPATIFTVVLLLVVAAVAAVVGGSFQIAARLDQIDGSAAASSVSSAPPAR